MAHRIVRDVQSKSYLIYGKGHSYGSFNTWGEANQFLKGIEADNKAHAARQAEARVQIHKDIEEREADRQAFLAAQRESDRLLYEGGAL